MDRTRAPISTFIVLIFPSGRAHVGPAYSGIPEILMRLDSLRPGHQGSVRVLPAAPAAGHVPSGGIRHRVTPTGDQTEATATATTQHGFLGQRSHVGLADLALACLAMVYEVPAVRAVQAFDLPRVHDHGIRSFSPTKDHRSVHSYNLAERGSLAISHTAHARMGTGLIPRMRRLCRGAKLQSLAPRKPRLQSVYTFAICG